MWKPILAISLGSALGAVLRWLLGTNLNSLFPTVPPGALTANLVGGYIIGIAIAFFAQTPDVAPEWRLLSWAMGAIAIHVSGSLLMTLAGLASWQWLKHS